MKRLILRVGYAAQGRAQAFRAERNIRVQLVIGVIVVMAGFYFRITNVEWMTLLIASGIVISLELMDSAVERLVDLIFRERHPMAGKVKNTAAGAVLFFSVIALITGIVIFKKYII